MSNVDVNEIIEKAVGQVRTILVEAVQQADESARMELISQFNEAVGGTKITTVSARRIVSATKTAKKASAKKASKEAKAADKPKRRVSAETRAKLAENLAKARAAKAKKVKAEARAAKAEARAAAAE